MHPDYTPDFLNQLPKQAILINANSSDDFSEKIRDITKSYVILKTCRLDSDDGIANNYIESINNFEKFFIASEKLFPKLCALNFRSGSELNIETNELYNRDYPNSSFSVLFSRRQIDAKHKLIIDYHHAHIHKSVSTTNVESHNPMWCIVVHDCNVGNTIKGSLDEELRDKVITLFNFQ